jgi:hypothetical protein
MYKKNIKNHTMKEILSKRNKRILITNGYIYNIEKTNQAGNSVWRCKLRCCKGRMVTNTSKEIISVINHNHNGCEATCQAEIMRYKIKSASENSNNPVLEMLSNVVKNCDENVIAKLPKLASLKDSITRIRNKKSNYMPGRYKIFQKH